MYNTPMKYYRHIYSVIGNLWKNTQRDHVVIGCIALVFFCSSLVIPSLTQLQNILLYTAVCMGTGVVLFGILFDYRSYLLPYQPRLRLAIGAFLGIVLVSVIIRGGLMSDAFLGRSLTLDSFVSLATMIMGVMIIGSLFQKKESVLLLVISVFSTLAFIVFLSSFNFIFFKGTLPFGLSLFHIGLSSHIIGIVSLLWYVFAPRDISHKIWWGITLGGFGITLFGLFASHLFIWWLLTLIAGVIALVFLIIKTVKNSESVQTKIPWELGIFCIVLLGVITWSGFRHTWNLWYGMSLQDFFVVVRSILQQHPLLGIGQSFFDNAWNMFASDAVRVGVLQKISFSQGFSFFSTLLGTTGILGFASFLWLCFEFFEPLLQKIRNRHIPWSSDTWMIWSVIGLAMYMFILHWVAIGSTATLLLMVILFGALVALVYDQETDVRKQSIFLKKNIGWMLGLFLLIVVMMVMIVRSSIGALEIKSALRSTTEQQTYAHLVRATVLSPHDSYFRLSAQKIFDDTLRYQSALSSQEVQNRLAQVIDFYQQAIAYDPENYLNYVHQGDMFARLGSLGNKEAFIQAHQAYHTALLYYPYHPDIIARLLRIELQQNHITRAQYYMKYLDMVAHNQPETFDMLAHIAFAQKKYQQGAEFLFAGLKKDPYLVERWISLGDVLLQMKEYKLMQQVFEQGISVYKHPMIYYYLGIAYRELGDTVNRDRIYDYLKKNNAPVPFEKLRVQSLPNPTPVIVE